MIAIRYDGMVDRNALMESLGQASHLAKEKNTYRFLTDCSRMAADGHTLTDVFFGIKAVTESIPRIASYREAILRPRGAEADKLVSFWETTRHNRGLNIRIFDDRERALDWLRH